MKKISDPLQIARQAVAGYRSCYGTDLVSAIVYGSAAGGDFDPARSDINLLLVLSSLTLGMVEKSQQVQRQWLRRRVSRPLFIDRDYIASSIDSFPVEFLNMKGCYTLLHGEDVLAPLRIQMRDVRLQVERELKGKWLHLMHSWLEAKRHPRLLARLLGASMKDFAACFRALLFLRGAAVPRERTALFAAVEDVYGLQGTPLRRTLEAFRTGGSGRMAAVFPAYAEAIQKLTAIIDQQPTKEAA